MDDQVLNIDMTGVSDDYEPLPVGIYNAVVAEVKQGLSRASNQPKLDFVFRIVDEEFAGRKAFLTCSLQKKALFNLKRTLRALGWSDEELAGPLALDPKDLLDLECSLLIEADVDQRGRPTTRVSRVLPAGQATGPAEDVRGNAIPAPGRSERPVSSDDLSDII